MELRFPIIGFIAIIGGSTDAMIFGRLMTIAKRKFDNCGSKFRVFVDPKATAAFGSLVGVLINVIICTISLSR